MMKGGMQYVPGSVPKWTKSSGTFFDHYLEAINFLVSPDQAAMPFVSLL